MTATNGMKAAANAMQSNKALLMFEDNPRMRVQPYIIAGWKHRIAALESVKQPNVRQEMELNRYRKALEQVKAAK